MSGDFNGPKNFSLISHKVNWPVAINCPELRKFETLQREQTSAARPHMIIQTDASTKGWRHTASFK